MSIAEELLFSERFQWEGKSYVVHIYRHAAKQERCLHMAETVLGPGIPSSVMGVPLRKPYTSSRRFCPWPFYHAPFYN